MSPLIVGGLSCEAASLCLCVCCCGCCCIFCCLCVALRPFGLRRAVGASFVRHRKSGWGGGAVVCVGGGGDNSRLDYTMIVGEGTRDGAQGNPTCGVVTGAISRPIVRSWEGTTTAQLCSVKTSETSSVVPMMPVSSPMPLPGRASRPMRGSTLRGCLGCQAFGWWRRKHHVGQRWMLHSQVRPHGEGGDGSRRSLVPTQWTAAHVP